MSNPSIKIKKSILFGVLALFFWVPFFILHSPLVKKNVFNVLVSQPMRPVLFVLFYIGSLCFLSVFLYVLKRKGFPWSSGRVRVLAAFLFAATIWLAPIVIQPPASQSELIRKPLQEYHGIVPVVAGANGVLNNKLNCSVDCQIEVCTKWSPVKCGTNPWDIGCCLSYATQCDPNCSDPTPPNQPPTITSSVSCTQLGDNGWCVGGGVLTLTASDPQSYTLTISGDIGGTPFICNPGTVCFQLLPQGNGAINYKVDALQSGLSAAGSTTWKLDATSPSVNGTLAGVAGSNGWYLGSVTYNGSASDPLSGLASLTCSLDGSPLGSCSTIMVSTEGAYTLSFVAKDNAGNTQTFDQSVSLDLQNPNLTSSISGTLGSNGWYNAATLSASASDPGMGSGLLALEYSLDNGGWVVFPASGSLDLTEGVHGVDVRAMDVAGRVTTSTKSYSLDATLPFVSVNPSGTLASNGWYISNLSVSASASDSVSGVDIFEYSLNNGAWTTYSSPITLTDGVHSLSFWVQDISGLVTQVDETYKVDTQAPKISGSLSGVPGNPSTGSGQDAWYVSKVTISVSAADPAPGSGVEALIYILNDGTQTTYANPIVLSDGEHTIRFDAQDYAGLTDTLTQIVKVDTITPTLNIETTLPNWNKDAISIHGTSSDSGSGLSKVEISLDGTTWSNAVGATSWTYDWDTTTGVSGVYKVHIRAVDNAGNDTEQLLSIGVDNTNPKIILPEWWFQWDTVTLDAWDSDSGLESVRVEISDPEGRWKMRKIDLDPDSFPLDFQWDRRFGDGTVAPLGSYKIKVFATDKMGNTAQAYASIKILLGILPENLSLPPQPYTRINSTPVPAPSTIPVPTATKTPAVNAFGSTPEPSEQTESIVPSIVVTPRVTPTKTTVKDWIESVFTSINTEETSTDVNSPEANTGAFEYATYAAMLAAVTAYTLAEKKRKEDEARRQVEAAARRAEEPQMTRQEAKRAKQREQLQKIWDANGAAIYEAKKDKARRQAVQNEHMEAKMGRFEQEEEAEWEKLEQAKEKAMNDWKAGEKGAVAIAGQYAMEQYREGEKEVSTQVGASWWQKNIVEPTQKILNAKSVIGGLIAISVGGTAIMANNVANNPHIFDEARSNAQVEWQQVVQGYPEIQAGQKTKFEYMLLHPYEALSGGYDATKVFANLGAGYVDAVWQQNPISQIISNGLEYLGDHACPELFGEAWYRRCDATLHYGASLVEHPADTIVGVGTALIADLAAGAIKTVAFELEYNNPVRVFSDLSLAIRDNGLTQGIHEYFDNRIALTGRLLSDQQVQTFGLLVLFLGIATIPVVGTMVATLGGGALVGWQGINTFFQIDKTLQSSSTRTDAMEYVSNQSVRRTVTINLFLMALVAFGAVRGIEEIKQIRGFQELLSPSSQVKFNKFSMIEQARLADLAIKMDLSPGALEFYLSESARLGSPLTQLPLVDAMKVSSLVDVYGKDAMAEFLPFCEKYGINPYEALTRPPIEGQSLFGWGLGIENPENPINHPLINLNLTDAEIKNILAESMKNPNSKVVVLGYGSGVKPYFILGNEITGSFLSLSPEAWAPFENARANFWIDVNAPFIEMAIEQRKIFLFNIDKNTIIDPLNVGRYSLPELNLIELPANNYVHVEFGQYDLYVPRELQGSYLEYLPESLLGELK